MKELFLHYIWQYQRYRHDSLATTDDIPLHVLHPGHQNDDAGPDFHDARIRIHDLTWVGRVEIHIRSSDWIAHQHDGDQRYDNVILHVVWTHDRDIYLANGEKIPTLELMGRVSESLIAKSNSLISSPQPIACAPKPASTDDILRAAQVSKSLVDRLREKSEAVLEELSKTNGDWEETTYRHLAGCFGGHLNKEPFLTLSRSLPLRILRRHSENPKQISALLYGMAGFLEGKASDEYHQQLQDEFQFLLVKYDLEVILSRYHWRFHRTRPANFPTVRMAQFASMLLGTPDLYYLTNFKDKDALKASLAKDADQYWMDHYDLGKESRQPLKSVGKAFVKGLMINGIVPILAASSIHFDEPEKMERAISLLEGSAAENNKITRSMIAAGFLNDNAADSQGLLQLYRHHCKKKRCLACNIGVSILKP